MIPRPVPAVCSACGREFKVSAVIAGRVVWYWCVQCDEMNR